MGDIRPYLWSKDRTEKLKKLWNEGMKPSEITKILGGFSHCKEPRNAVIGKLNRLLALKEIEPREQSVIHSSKPSPPSRSTRQPTNPPLKHRSSQQEAFSPFPAPTSEVPADVIRALKTAFYQD